jgi:hypothetical protein
MTSPSFGPAIAVARSERMPFSGSAMIRGPLPVWAALFANLLAFSGLPTLFPIPGIVGQLITQGALLLALMLVFLANPAGVMRPSLVLVLLTCLGLMALVVSFHSDFLFSSIFRASRLIVLTVVLWLLTPWWGRSDLSLLRSHLICLRIVLVTVLIGALVAPGAAFSYGGRLSGALWPIPPTQVAHYAAVMLGCTVVLWFCGSVSGRNALISFIGGVVVLAGTHTRTARLAGFAGLLIASASLFVGHARVRRTSALVGFVVVLAATTLGPLLREWALRGQTAQEAGQLTGRTKVWSAVFQLRRPPLEELFGSGLSNKSFNGLPIDSNWVATYLDQGWFGISITVMVLLTIVLLAVTHPRGPERAVALFLVTYCLIASITETGLGDASPYLLELVLAASLLAAPARTGAT